ncbi:MAG: hypothetical protein ACOCQR_00765 [bacterium]
MSNKLEKLAREIAELLSQRGMAYDTAIYYDGKRLQCFTTNEEDGWVEEEGYKASNYTEYANDETITMTFEGPMYDVLNYHADDEFVEKFDMLIEKYGYMYELGNAWNLSLYERG